MQCALCSVHIIVNTVIGGLIVDAVECTPKSVECRVLEYIAYSVQCSVYSVQCTVFSVQ